MTLSVRRETITTDIMAVLGYFPFILLLHYILEANVVLFTALHLFDSFSY